MSISIDSLSDFVPVATPEIVETDIDSHHLEPSDKDAPETYRADPYDAVESFAREIRRYSLLSAAEERDLASRIRAVQPLLRIRESMAIEIDREPTLVEWAENLSMDVEELSKTVDAGAAAKETLVNANLRLVVHIAKRFHKSRGSNSVPLLDLIQEGALSLIRVAELYDPERGFRFASYAWPAVVARIRRASNNPPGAVVRVPERLRRTARKLHKYRQQRLQKTGALPTAEEEAEMFSTDSLALVKRATPHLESALLLDQPVAEAEGTSTLSDMLASDAEQPEDAVNRSIIISKVRESIEKHLNARTVEILVAKFGLDGNFAMRSTEIAERYGISPPRVHQVISDALAKLRKKDPELEKLFMNYS